MSETFCFILFRLELELERDKRERDARERDLRERELREMEMREKMKAEMEMKPPGTPGSKLGRADVYHVELDVITSCVPQSHTVVMATYRHTLSCHGNRRTHPQLS